MTGSLPRAALLAFVVTAFVFAATETAATDEAAAEQGCAAAEGLEPILGPSRVVLLGEIHGTEQAPAFAATVACRALRKGLGVTIGLELPHREEPVVRRFVGSSPPVEDDPGIVHLPFWAQSYQDGRASEAMLSLIERVRAWRLAGEDVDVRLLDDPSAFRQRDAFMAERVLAAVSESPERFLVVLTGNFHSRTVEGSGRMGERVSKALGRDRVKSLNMTHEGGSAWICEATAGCGSLDLGSRETEPAGRVTLFAEPDARGYDGAYSVGPISASLPAKDRKPDE